MIECTFMVRVSGRCYFITKRRRISSYIVIVHVIAIAYHTAVLAILVIRALKTIETVFAIFYVVSNNILTGYIRETWYWM